MSPVEGAVQLQRDLRFRRSELQKEERQTEEVEEVERRIEAALRDIGTFSETL